MRGVVVVRTLENEVGYKASEHAVDK